MVEQLHALLTDDDEVEAFVRRLHAETGAVDLKRGEYYPELLRSMSSFRELVASVMGIAVAQVQPNFGSNGSIDTLFTAARLVESERMRAWEQRRHTALLALAQSRDVPADAVARLLAESDRLRPGSGVLVATPTYFRNYNSAASKGLALHAVPVTADYQFDTDAFIEALGRLRPTLAVLVTPNNPTGIAIPDDAIDRVLSALPDSTWCMIDRTLVNSQQEVATRALLERWTSKNLVVLHSFSKYKGMSQHRVGVALYSNPAFAQQLEPMLPLCLSLEGCVKAMRWVARDRGFQPSAQTIRNIRESRAALDAFVEQHPRFSITDFSGNYGLMTLPPELDSHDVGAALAAQGLYVMPGHGFPESNPRVIRVHVGGAVDDVRLLLHALSAFA